MNEEAMDRLEGYASALKSAITDVAPHLWDKMVQLKQITSIIYVTSGAIIGALFFAVLIGAVNFTREAFKKKQAGDESYTWEDFFYHREGYAAMIVCAGVLCLAWAFGSLITIHNWIGVFAPELAVFKDLYQAALSKLD